MRKVDIILRDKRLRNHVLVNNKSIRFSRDKNTHVVLYHFETEDDSFNLKLDPYHPLLQKGWYWINLGFFIFTIFGIFDCKYKTKFIYRYEDIVSLNEGDNKIIIKPIRDKNKCICIDTICSHREVINYKELDKRIKKRKGLLTLTKVLIILLSIATLVTLLIVFLGQ